MFNWWLQRDHGPQGSGNQRYSSVTQSSQHEVSKRRVMSSDGMATHYTCVQEDDVEKMNQALRNLEKQDSKNEDNGCDGLLSYGVALRQTHTVTHTHTRAHSLTHMHTHTNAHTFRCLSCLFWVRVHVVPLPLSPLPAVFQY